MSNEETFPALQMFPGSGLFAAGSSPAAGCWIASLLSQHSLLSPFHSTAEVTSKRPVKFVKMGRRKEKF